MKSLLSAITACTLLLEISAFAQDKAREVKEHFEDGELHRVYRVDAQDRKTGTYKEYHRNGKRKLWASYRDDLLVGRYTAFNEKGRKVVLTRYVRGKLHGKFEEWFDSGKRKTTSKYQHGKRTGKHLEFFADGETRIESDYADGLRHGKHIERTPEKKKVLVAHYANGLLHGDYRVIVDGVLSTDQTYAMGKVVAVEGVVLHPVSRHDLETEINRLLSQPFNTEQEQALHYLQAYRFLCRVPYEGMSVDTQFNEYCAAAARVCEANGKLSHTPPRPPGMEDKAFHQGYHGASHSNLAIGDGGLPGSIDQYMDDSDTRNIDHVGHRRWCLNPAMRKSGFGSSNRFHAMWSMDESGSNANTGDTFYPPQGYTPLNFVRRGCAWSVMFPGIEVLTRSNIEIRIQEMNADYQKSGKLLKLDHVSVMKGDGRPSCLIFRSRHVQQRVGFRYWVEISLDGGRTNAVKYLVEFIEPVRGEGAASPRGFLLRDPVRRTLNQRSPGIAFGMIAEVRRDPLRMAIVWPGLLRGKPDYDEHTVGILFRKSEKNQWVIDPGDVELSRRKDDVERSLIRAMRDHAGLTVLRRHGVPRDQLAAYLSRHGKAFSAAVAGNDTEGALSAYEHLCRAFSIEMVAYRNALPSLLRDGLLDHRWEISEVSGADMVARIPTHDAGKSMRLSVKPSGEGIVITGIKE